MLKQREKQLASFPPCQKSKACLREWWGFRPISKRWSRRVDSTKSSSRSGAGNFIQTRWVSSFVFPQRFWGMFLPPASLRTFPWELAIFAMGINSMRWLCTHARCYTTAFAHMLAAIHHGWGGGGGRKSMRRLCIHARCYPTAFAHMLDAIRHGWGGGGGRKSMRWLCIHARCCLGTHARCYAPRIGWGGGCKSMRWLCIHARCYATAFAHMLDAIRHGWGGGGGRKSMRWLCIHARCYTTALAHMLDAIRHGWGGGGVCVRACVDFAYMLDATPLPLHTCSVLRQCL